MTSGDTVDRRVEQVAEAIRHEWYSQRAAGAQANDWDRLAAAAIAALGLTTEEPVYCCVHQRGHDGPCEPPL